MDKIIRIRVTPKTSSNRVVQDVDENGAPLLRVYVTTVPEDGKANQAVLKLLSREMKIPKSALEIIQGIRGRDKVVRIRLPE